MGAEFTEVQPVAAAVPKKNDAIHRDGDDTVTESTNVSATLGQGAPISITTEGKLRADKRSFGGPDPFDDEDSSSDESLRGGSWHHGRGRAASVARTTTVVTTAASGSRPPRLTRTTGWATRALAPIGTA
ncbi:hypothetical protein PR003_g11782 [Phytophthora rubi]|uniref:Uncharacterized protein n=1 Tax=Phytophthora rubi TaxID=129364 RepID=A0A6A4FKC9_9STRA|nr:hypothetical protein PR003_g11782 [Phytophthora rubi]